MSPRERTAPVFAPTRSSDGTLSTPSSASGCRRAKTFIPDDERERDEDDDDERDDVYTRFTRHHTTNAHHPPERRTLRVAARRSTAALTDHDPGRRITGRPAASGRVDAATRRFFR